MKFTYLIVAAAITTPVQAELANVPAAAELAGRNWQAALDAGDVAALSGMYTRDAVVIPPSQEIIANPARIGDFWKAKLASGTGAFRVQTINTREDGNRVYQTGVWSATVNSNGKVSHLDGEMTTIIVRQPDGSWKIELQNWY